MQTRRDVARRLPQDWETWLASGRLSAVGRVTTGVAHELTNPLTIILGCAHLASESLPAGHAASGQLRAIERAARRCQTLLQDLVEFASHRVEQPAAFELGDALNEALSFVQPLARHHSLELITDFGSRRLPLSGRREELRTALVHLCACVIDAAAPGGSLSVRARAKAGGAELHVTACGGGAAPRSRRGVRPPVGLLLALEIVRRHGGVVRAVEGGLSLRVPLARA